MMRRLWMRMNFPSSRRTISDAQELAWIYCNLLTKARHKQNGKGCHVVSVFPNSLLGKTDTT